MAFDPESFLLEDEEEQNLNKPNIGSSPTGSFDPYAFLAEDDRAFTQPAQPAYKYDPSRFRPKGLTSTKAEQKPEDQSVFRQVADIPLGVARGGVIGIKMMTDILGADNPVSKSLAGVEGYMADLMSAQAKEDQQEISRILKDAEDKGLGEQVKAGIKAFSIAPVDIMSQALGTMAPVLATGLAGSAAKLGALGIKGLQLGVGAGMGAGMIKGEIYNEVKNELINSGTPEEVAEKAAVDAQAYGGKNLDQILLGAGLGAASTLGAEGIITRILTKQGKASTAGIVSRVLKGGITEAIPEGVQAAQEQLAKNVALQREGFDVDPSRGVVSAATMEAIAGAPLGGIAGVIESPAKVKTIEEEKFEQTNEIARNAAENGAPLTASALQDKAAVNLNQDELAKKLDEELSLSAVKPSVAAPMAIPTKDEYVARYSAIAQTAPEELTRAEQSFTNELATADTEDKRINAQNALDAIKQVKAAAAAQQQKTDATKEIIQQQGVREEPQDGTQVEPTTEAGVSDSLLSATRSEEEGQVDSTIFDLQSVANNTATREQISSLSLSGLVDIRRGQAIINEDGEGILAQAQAPLPKLTPEARAAEVEAAQVPKTRDELVSELEKREAGKDRLQELTSAGERFEEENQILDDILGIDPNSKESENLSQKERVARLTPEQRIEYGNRLNSLVSQRFTFATAPVEATPVTPTPSEPIIGEEPQVSSIVGEQVTETTPVEQVVETQIAEEPIISEKPQTSEIVGAETPTIVEQEQVAPAVSQEFKDELEMSGVAYDGDTRYSVQQSSDGTFRAERIVNGSREDIAIGLPDIETAQGVILNSVGKETPAITAETPTTITPETPQQVPSGMSVEEAEAYLDERNKSTIFGYAPEDIMAMQQGKRVARTIPPAPVTEPVVEPSRTGITEPAIAAEEQVVTEREAAPAEGIVVGNRVKFDNSPQTYTIEEVIPQTAKEQELGEQRYSIKNERTGDVQVVREMGLKKVGGKKARKIAAATKLSDSLDSGEFNSAQALVDQGTTMDRETFIRSITPSATQRATTIHTRLEKDGVISKEEFADGRGLVYGDGRGAASSYLGGQSYEPFPPAGFTPDYTGDRVEGKGDAIDGKFSTILNTFVLNVVDPQTRSFIVKDIANLLQNGGRAVFVTRGSDVANSKALVSFAPLERIQRSEGKLTYQKGFTQKELIKYLKETLGDGFSVNGLRGGTASDVRVEVIKNTDAELNNPPITQDVRLQAAEFQNDEIVTPIPEANRYTYEEAVKLVDSYFDKEGIPEGVVIVNNTTEPDLEMKAGYFVDRGQIVINLAYIAKGENLSDIISHELGHYIFGDPEFQAEFKKFWDLMTPEEKAEADRLINQFYNAETGAVQMEEKQVRAFMQLIQEGNAQPQWKKILDTIKRWINKYLKTNFQVTDRNALAVLAAAHKRFKSGERIIREIDSGVLKMAAEPKRERVAGKERGEIITTPEGIIEQSKAVIRNKFFDGTEVSDERTLQAWNYIEQFLDIESGASNELAGLVNDVVDQETNSKARMGASLLHTELGNYAAKLADQGDMTMLPYIIRRINRMRLDNLAGDISEYARGMRARQELDINGFNTLKTENESKVERTAAALFGTSKPSKEQVKVVKDAIDAADEESIGTPEDVAAEIEKVEKRTGRKVIKAIDDKIKESTEPKKEELLISFENLDADRKIKGITIKYNPQKVNVAKNIKDFIIGKMVDYRKTLVNQGAGGLESTFWQTMSDQENKPGPLGELDQAQNNELAKIVKNTLIKLGLKGEPPNTKMTDIEKVASILNENKLSDEKRLEADSRIVEEIERRRQSELASGSSPEAVNAKYDVILDAWNEAMSRQIDMPVSENMFQRLIKAELKERKTNLSDLLSEKDEIVFEETKNKIVDSILSKVYKVSKESETGIEMDEDYSNLKTYLKQTLNNMYADAMQLNSPISDNMLKRLIKAELKELKLSISDLINEQDGRVSEENKNGIISSILKRVYRVSKDSEIGIKTDEDYNNLQSSLNQALDNMYATAIEKKNAAYAKRQAQLSLKNNVEGQAQSIINQLSTELSDTPSFSPQIENKAKTIVQQDLRQKPNMGRKQPWTSQLTAKLIQAGVSEVQAQKISDLVWRQHEIKAMDRELKELQTAAEKGSLAVIIQRIKDTPLAMQQEPNWMQGVIREYLVEAGLSENAAKTAARLYESVISERFAEAKQKAFEAALNKSAPWNNFLSRNVKLGKDALKKIQEAIRTGVLDPTQTTESIIAKQNGWSGFSKEQLTRIVQLDDILSDSNANQVTKAEAMSELNKIIVKAKMPVRFKDAISSFYVAQALNGIPTFTVNIAGPTFFAIRNLAIDVAKYAVTDPQNIPVAFQSFMNSMQNWKDNSLYAFKNQIYMSGEIEYMQGQNVLRELFDKGLDQWKRGEYANGMANMLVGMMQITGRVLSSLDQGAIAMMESQNIPRYALDAMASNKKIPKDKRKEIANIALYGRSRMRQDLIESGMSPERAGVLADLQMRSELMASLSEYGISKTEVLDASLNDALQSVGRNRVITTEGYKQERNNLRDAGITSGLAIGFLENLASSSSGGGQAQQIFARMLYGFALVPARVFSTALWFSPVGFVRLGVDSLLKKAGFESRYAMSLATDLQYKQRVYESIAGTVLLGALASLVKSSTDDEDDELPFKIVVTGNGPNYTTDPQYYDSWHKRNKPGELSMYFGKTKFTLNIGRGGEAVSIPFMIAGAFDDWNIKSKQNSAKNSPKDLEMAAEVLGSAFYAFAQRGPWAAFGKPLFDAKKQDKLVPELFGKAAYLGKTFVPILGSSLARNISDFINDPIDKSSVQGAIYANTPVIGPMLGTKALNALGQPVRGDDWNDKLFKLGAPIVFSFPKNSPENDLNILILKKGDGPTIPTRTNAQKKFGDVMTDKEFETYVREYGRVVSDKMFKNRKRLEGMNSENYTKELDKYVNGYSIDGIKVTGASDMAIRAVRKARNQ